jgi:hypothetical protein
MNIDGFSDDINGYQRPQGVSWDIGAYEHVTGTPPISTITPPTNLHLINIGF